MCSFNIFNRYSQSLDRSWTTPNYTTVRLYCTVPQNRTNVPYHSTVPRPKTIPQNSLTYCIYQKKDVFFRRVGSVPILSTLPYHCTVPYPKTVLQNRTPKTVYPKPYPKTVPRKPYPEKPYPKTVPLVHSKRYIDICPYLGTVFGVRFWGTVLGYGFRGTVLGYTRTVPTLRKDTNL